MIPSPTSNPATEKLVDIVSSQAIEIAKDVAVPAAKSTAVRFFRTRAKSLLAVVVVASAIAAVIHRKKATASSSDTPSPDAGRPAFDGAEDPVAAKEDA